MSLRFSIVLVLVSLLAVSPARAQEPSEMWQAFASRLHPGSFVVVTLTNGVRVQGRLVQVAPDTMTVLPKPRIAVPVRMLAFADVQSIDTPREGLSPGAKVLIGAGVAAGALLATFAVALAGGR